MDEWLPLIHQKTQWQETRLLHTAEKLLLPKTLSKGLSQRVRVVLWSIQARLPQVVGWMLVGDSVGIKPWRGKSHSDPIPNLADRKSSSHRVNFKQWQFQVWGSTGLTKPIYILFYLVTCYFHDLWLLTEKMSKHGKAYKVSIMCHRGISKSLVIVIMSMGKWIRNHNRGNRNGVGLGQIGGGSADE